DAVGAEQEGIGGRGRGWGMSQAGSDERIIALREAIQRSGRANRSLWILVFGWLALDPLWLVLLFLVHRGPEVPIWFVWLLGMWFVGVPVLAYAAYSFLRRARAEIRKLWNPLTAEERSEAMLPLGHKACWPGPTKEVMLPF